MADIVHAAPTELLKSNFDGPMSLPEVVIYEHRTWQGWSYRTNLNLVYVGDGMNDKISSLVVVSGTWRFYEDRDFGGKYWDLGPGYYEYIPDSGIPSDVISSFQCISL